MPNVRVSRWCSLGDVCPWYVAAKWQSGTQQRADGKLLCPMNLLIFEDNWCYYYIPCFSRGTDSHHTYYRMQIDACRGEEKNIQFQSPSVPMSQRQMCILCLKTPLPKANSKILFTANLLFIYFKIFFKICVMEDIYFLHLLSRETSSYKMNEFWGYNVQQGDSS